MNKKHIIIAAILIGLTTIPAIAADLTTPFSENLPQDGILELEQTEGVTSSALESSPQSIGDVEKRNALSESGSPDIILFQSGIASLTFPSCEEIEGTACLGSCPRCQVTEDCPVTVCMCMGGSCHCPY